MELVKNHDSMTEDRQKDVRTDLGETGPVVFVVLSGYLELITLPKTPHYL